MAKCIFCGTEQSSFMGMHLINNDGTVSYFCSSKCRKNVLHLKRDKRKWKWTEAHGIAQDKADAKIVRDKEKVIADAEAKVKAVQVKKAKAEQKK